MHTSTGIRRGATAGVWTVAAVFLITMVGTTLPTPLYPIYEEHFGFGGLVVTFVFATYAVGVLGALLLAGTLSDQVGRRPVLLMAAGFAAVSSIVFLVPDSIPALFAGRLLSGISAGIITGTATATIVDLASQRWKSAAGMLAASVNMLGLGLGPVLAGVLAQYAPAPLQLPYVVHLVLVLVLAAAVIRVSEPVPNPGSFRIQVQRLSVPPSVRHAFVPAAIAGFAGFAVLGLFTAVSPLFLSSVVHVTDHALTGLVVFVLLGSSTLGQLLSSAIATHRCLVGGCFVLAVGVLLVGTGVGAQSLAVFTTGAVVAGLGQGMSFRSGLASVTSSTPTEQRSAVSSTFFLVLYIAISLPVIGVGAAAEAVGIVAAGVGFSVLVAVLACAAGALLLVRGRVAAP